jgi:hypothetical protein
MHHKRKKRRNLRAGCKMCKPWKQNGVNKWSKRMARASDFRNLTEGPDEDGEREVDLPHNIPVLFFPWP